MNMSAVEWLAENYTPEELAELLVIILKDDAHDLVRDDGLCAGELTDVVVYPEMVEQWFRHS